MVATSEESSPNISICLSNEQLVIVSHINSPHQFFVTNPQIVEAIDSACLSESKKAPCPGQINVDNVYLIEKNKKWYRVKVTEERVDNEFQIFFVDYGQKEMVLHNG